MMKILLGCAAGVRVAEERFETDEIGGRHRYLNTLALAKTE